MSTPILPDIHSSQLLPGIRKASSCHCRNLCGALPLQYALDCKARLGTNMESAQAFRDHVEDLTDLELAVLLSLVAQHHCMVVANDELLDDIASELALVGCWERSKPIADPRSDSQGHVQLVLHHPRSGGPAIR